MNHWWGRTTIWDEDRQWRAVIEFPIGYMNIHPPAGRFQVGRGGRSCSQTSMATTLPLISRMELAYVMFHDWERAEFAVRIPTPVGPELPV